MKRRISMWIAVAFIMSVHGQIHALANDNMTSTALQNTYSTNGLGPIAGQFYQVKEGFKAMPVGIEANDGSIANVNGQVIDFNVGDGYQVVATAKTADGQTLVRIEADRDWGSDAWFNLADLPQNAVEMVNPDSVQLPDTTGMDDDEIYSAMNGIGEQYEETLVASKKKPARKKTRGGSLNCTSHPTAVGCCYSAVKYRLQAMGLVNHRLEGVDAKQASKALPNNFKEIHCTKQRFTNPVKGEVCTFSGGAHGHVEIYSTCANGKMGWYYGAHCGTPMNSPARHCFSCKVPRK